MLQSHQFPSRGSNRPLSPAMQKAAVFLLAIGAVIIVAGFGFIAVVLMTRTQAEPPATSAPASLDLGPWLLPDDHRIISLGVGRDGTVVLLEDTDGHRAVYAYGGAGVPWTPLISNHSCESTLN